MGFRRTSNNNFVSLLLIIILAVLIFFVPSYGWQLRAWLGGSSNNAAGSGTQADSTSTLAETMALQAQVDELQIMQDQAPNAEPDYIKAMVYSRYPLNFKNEILVNVGSNEGVATGSAALFQGVLIGQVQKVFSDYSMVQTVFDNGVKMPVRIGTKGADGLLQGSSYPTIGSISNTAPITAGDVIYSAAPGLPYGLPIGTVAATSTSPDNLFQQATLNFSYDLNTIQTVLIEKQH